MDDDENEEEFPISEFSLNLTRTIVWLWWSPSRGPRYFKKPCISTKTFEMVAAFGNMASMSFS
jgi:hypothetical protein